MRVSVRRSGNQGESGAVLLLVAAVVVFIGVFLMMGLGVFDTRDDYDSRRITYARSERIINFLSSFAQNYDRIPCPANPAIAAGTANYGTEDRGGSGTACNRREGMIPFRALGLTQSDVRDGWGNIFSYGVSPVFTIGDTLADSGINVFNACRQLESWVTDAEEHIPPAPNKQTAARNMNPAKAKFCCPGNGAGWPSAGSDIRIFTDSVGGNDVPEYPGGRTTDATAYGDMDSGGTGGVSASQTSEALAFVLISPGADGVINPENGNGDGIYLSRPLVPVPGDPNYFDDMLFYRTQVLLYAKLNNGVCFIPFR